MNRQVLSEITRMKQIMGLLNEQVVTDYDSKYDYKKEGDKYYTRRKGSTKWIESTGSSLNSIKTKVFKDVESSGSNPNTTPTRNTSPFKTREEGDRFRKWVNDNYPNYAKQINLDVSGSHTNSYIIKAAEKYGKAYAEALKQSQPENSDQDNIVVSDDIAPEFLSQINFDNLSTSDTTHNFCKPGQENCAQFVNDMATDVAYVGNAWTAYNNSRLGDTVYSAFNNLDERTQKEVTDLWLKINKRGGGKENGPSNKEVANLVNRLVPGKGSVKNTDLKVNDFVGIFYPKSDHHEEAFYEAGTPWFTKDEDGNLVPGETIKTGRGWGMNTHIGRVFAIKDGVPLIGHNVIGDAQSSPPSDLRIAWIKRPGGGQTMLNKIESGVRDAWENITDWWNG